MKQGKGAGQRQKYERYKTTKKREKNKIVKIIKHLKKFGNDMKSVERMNELRAIVGK